MQNVLVAAIIIFSFSAYAQAPAMKKNMARTPASAVSTPAVKISIEEEAQRILYAKELMNVMDVNKAIVQSLDGADLYFQRPIAADKDDKDIELTRKALIAGKAKFDANKSKLPQQINDQLVKELTQRYSSVELKYLIEITKYPLYKKFREYIESDEYYGLIGKPYSEARSAVSEAKRNIASEPSPAAPKAAKKK